MLVLPAALTGDGATHPLRRFLTRCGFRAHPWVLGVNWGPTPALRAGLRRRLLDLRAREGVPVSLVGVSMGRPLARDLAHDHPEAVRQVITVASPFRLPTATTLAPVFCALWRRCDPAVDLDRLARPPPVPAMAICTRDDGIVAWRSCVFDGPGCPNLELTGVHITLCRDPRARPCRHRGPPRRGLTAAATARPWPGGSLAAPPRVCRGRDLPPHFAFRASPAEQQARLGRR